MNKSTQTIYNYLPPLLKEYGIAEKLKAMNNAYALAMEYTENNAELYGNIQDLEHNSGVYLDATCKLYNKFRFDGETDEELRDRTRLKIVTDTSDCSIVAINEKIKAINPSMYVIENTYGIPALLQIRGASSIEEYDTAYEYVNEMRAAGIAILASLVATDRTWQEVYDAFPTWNDLEQYYW